MAWYFHRDAPYRARWGKFCAQMVHSVHDRGHGVATCGLQNFLRPPDHAYPTALHNLRNTDRAGTSTAYALVYILVYQLEL